MRQRLFRRMGLKLLAVLCAIIGWLIVINISDPIGTKIFSPIPVTLKNENILTDNNMVYQILDNTDSVSVQVTAPRSVLSALTESDIQVVADFDNITLMNTVPLQASAMRYSRDIEEITLETSNLKLEVEMASTRQISVDVRASGTPQDGFAVSALSATPSVVTVTGPESLMEKVASLETVVLVEDRRASFSSSSTVRVLDSDGKEIDSSRISLSDEDVLVDVTMLPTKSVNLKLNTSGECASGYRLVEVVSDPTTVVITGETSVLSGISTITIPAKEVDISGAVKNVQKEINIEEYLPEGATVPENEKSVITVTAKIEKLVEQTFSVPASQISIANTPANMTASFGSLTSVNVTVSGTQSDIADMTVNDIKASIDLENLELGLNTVEVALITPEGISVTQPVSVQVTLLDATPASGGA